MENYSKPLVLMNEELAEGVYAASGSDDCFKVSSWVNQRPETGRNYYVIKVDATHNAADKHHSANQVLTLHFNQPVTYHSCYGQGAAYVSGNGTNTLKIAFTYHQNGGPEGLGLADVNVTSAGTTLEVLDSSISCDHSCAYGHSW